MNDAWLLRCKAYQQGSRGKDKRPSVPQKGYKSELLLLLLIRFLSTPQDEYYVINVNPALKSTQCQNWPSLLHHIGRRFTYLAS